MPFDDIEGDVLFTRSALKADEDARELLPMTDGWLEMNDAARAKYRQAREQVSDADANRAVTNARLDQACTLFSDELWLAVGKDRKSARWLQFLTIPVHRFIRQGLNKQVLKVQGWLRSTDPVVEKHRELLTTRHQAAAAALEQTAGLATTRGEATMAREQLAEELTKERDGLHDALSELARQKGLPRDWPDVFFRKAKRTARRTPETAPPAEE